jgi:putative transposase
MNTRAIAAEYRLSHWAKIMQDRNESGMSIKEYCKTAGFHENKYYYWQRKLRALAYQEKLQDPGKESIGSGEMLTSLNQAGYTPSWQHIPSGWAMCEAAIEKEKTIAIEINGCRILANQNTDDELLLRTCRMLVKLC